MNKRMGKRMDRWMERESVCSLFLCVCAEVCSWLGESTSVSPSLCLPTSPAIYPSLSVWVYNNGVKHLQLPGNYGWAKTAASAAPTSSGTPQLALHLHLPQRPAYYLSEETRETEESAEWGKRQMSDPRGTRVVEDGHSNTTKNVHLSK